MTLGSRFARLQQRPPTPPREFPSSDPSRFAHDIQSPLVLPINTPETPTEFASSYFTENPKCRGTKRKRVNFILTPTHNNAGQSSSPSLPQLSPQCDRLPLLPRQPNSARYPSKSILKVSSHGLLSEISFSSETSIGIDYAKQSNWKTEKWEFINNKVFLLQTADKGLRLEAYQGLGKAIRADFDIAASDEFKRLISVITNFIKSELDKPHGADHRDSQLAIEALKVANTLVWKDAIPDTQLSPLLDSCIAALDQKNDASKSLFGGILLFISYIRSTKIFTTSRATRLIEILKNVDKRIKGKTLLILKFDIYDKLLKLSPQLMLQNSRLWLLHLLDGLLTDRRDTIQKAIKFGRTVGINYGDRKDVSRSFLSLLKDSMAQDHKTDKENSVFSKTYIGAVLSTMRHLLHEHENADLVPQIWSVIVLLLRNKIVHFRKWEHWDDWLTILQNCFNQDSVSVKGLANSAWRDLIWASQDEIVTDVNIRKSLFRPICGQLMRRDKDKSRSEAEQTFFAFIYYTLRPGSTHEIMDLVWQDFVSKVTAVYPEQKPHNTTFALQIFNSIFGTYEKEIWDRDRAIKPQKLNSSCLLGLEPQWIRLNIRAILRHLTPFFESSLSKGVGFGSEKACFATWSGIVAALAHCSKREVRPSPIALEATATLINFAFRGPVECSKGTEAYKFSTELIGELLTNHMLPLTQKCFTLDIGRVVIVESSPNLKDEGSRILSGLDLILEYLAPSRSTGCSDFFDGEHFSIALGRKFDTIKSRHERLSEVLKMTKTYLCDQCCFKGESGSKKSCMCRVIWRTLTATFIHSIHSLPCVSLDYPKLGQYLGDSVAHLAQGLQENIYEHIEWTKYLESVAKEVLSLAGPGGLVIGLLAPLAPRIVLFYAGSITCELENGRYLATKAFIELVPSMPSAQEISSARETLKGSSLELSTDQCRITESIMEVFALALQSSKVELINSAVKAWNIFQKGLERTLIPDNLYTALLKVSKESHIELHKGTTSGIKSADNTSLSLEGPIYRGRHLSGRKAGRRKRTHEEKASLSESSSHFLPERTEAIDSISSSPPEFCLPSKYPYDSPEETPPNGKLIDDIPLERSPISDILHFDSSPTPSRQISHMRTELAELRPTSSQPLEKLLMKEDHSDSRNVVENGPGQQSLQTKKRHIKARSETNTIKTRRSFDSTLNSENNGVRDEVSDGTLSKSKRDIAPVSARESVSNISDLSCNNIKHNGKMRTRLRSVRAPSDIMSLEITPSPKLSGTKTEPQGVVGTAAFTCPHSAEPQSQSFRTEISNVKQVETKLNARTRSQRVARRFKSSSDHAKDTGIQDCIVLKRSKVVTQVKGSEKSSIPSIQNITHERTTYDIPLSTEEMSFKTPCEAMSQNSPELSLPSRRSKRRRTASVHASDCKERGSEKRLSLPESKDSHKRKRGQNTAKEIEDSIYRPALKRQKLPTEKQREVLRSQSQSAKGEVETLNSPRASLSTKAQSILNRLRGLLEDVQNAVLGKQEATEIQHSLNNLSTATIDAEDRGRQ